MTLSRHFTAAALALATGIAAAQPAPAASGPNDRPLMGRGMAASGPMGGPMMGGRTGASAPMMGGRAGASAPMGGGMGRMGRMGPDNTPGWALMTPQERDAHHARMRSMTRHDECEAYMKEHREQMAARAKEKGRALPERPRRDACAALKP